MLREIPVTFFVLFFIVIELISLCKLFACEGSKVNISLSFPEGTWITKVEAVEQTSSRQRITYIIFSGNENHDFSINRHTGKKHAGNLAYKGSDLINYILRSCSGDVKQMSFLEHHSRFCKLF